MNAARRNMIMLALNALEGGNQSFVTMTSELRALAFAVIRSEVLADEFEQATKEIEHAKSGGAVGLSHDEERTTLFVTHIMATRQGHGMFPNIDVRTRSGYRPVVVTLAIAMCQLCKGKGVYNSTSGDVQCSCIITYAN